MAKVTGVRTGAALCRGAIAAVAVAITVTIVLASASTAMATEPTGDFAIFKQCPRFTPNVVLCLYAETNSGYITIGNATLPLNADKKHPLVLQGGIRIVEEKQTFVDALNGQTLSKTPQQVPGGLADFFSSCNEIKGGGWPERELRFACKLLFKNGLTNINAVTELAGEVGVNEAALESNEGPLLTLPVKVRLENWLLGSKCYIGSNAKPIMLDLTPGTTHPAPPNQPITGKDGESTFKDELEFIELTNNTLVNNEFSVPEATGCGGVFSFLIDPIINAKLGLPSPDGRNTVVQNNTVYVGGVPFTLKSEK